MSGKEGEQPDIWDVSETPDGRIQDWLTLWENGCWDYYYTEPGPNLAKYFDKFTDERKCLKILLPLCATTYDLIWLCKQGHTVVGADLSETAAQRIFKQYKQEPVIEDVPSMNGKLYKNETGTFKFYVGNFFLFNEHLEGTFDFIWDSKAISAVDRRDRPNYVKVIRSVMGPKCTMMLEVPKELLPGARYNCFTEEQLKEIYGDICDMEYLDEYDFNMANAFHGDLDEEGRPLGEEKEGDWEEMVIRLQSYCLRKRE